MSTVPPSGAAYKDSSTYTPEEIREFARNLVQLASLLALCVEVVLSGDHFPSMRFASAVAAATAQSIEKLLNTPSAP